MARPVHQSTSVGELQKGDHIAMKMREGVVTFYHHAIIESKDTSHRTVNVIHRVPDQITRGVYEEGTDGPFYVVIHSNRRYNRAQTYKRAKGRMNEQGFNLCDQNCEHFANWCVTGRAISFQVKDRPLACMLCRVASKKKSKKTGFLGVVARKKKSKKTSFMGGVASKKKFKTPFLGLVASKKKSKKTPFFSLIAK